MESFGRIVEIIVTVILLFLVPIQYTAAKQDMVCQTYVSSETAYLVDSVRNLGYLSKNMYETFLKKLRESNHIYKIELTHYQKRSDIQNSQEAALALEEDLNHSVNYYGIYTEDILNELYQASQGGQSGSYYFRQGDYFSVKVMNLDKTLWAKIKEMLYGRSFHDNEIMAVYGGGIRDEAY